MKGNGGGYETIRAPTLNSVTPTLNSVTSNTSIWERILADGRRSYNSRKDRLAINSAPVPKVLGGLQSPQPPPPPPPASPATVLWLIPEIQRATRCSYQGRYALYHYCTRSTKVSCMAKSNAIYVRAHFSPIRVDIIQVSNTGIVFTKPIYS